MAQCNELGSWITYQLLQAYHQYGVNSRRLYKLPKRCTELAAASDTFYQLLTFGRWFSPGTPAFSTAKTGRHDIAKILLKMALNTINQSINQYCVNDEGGNRRQINEAKIHGLLNYISCQVQ